MLGEALKQMTEVGSKRSNFHSHLEAEDELELE